MKIRIIQGTRSSGENLCLKCKWAHVMRGAGESQEIIHCDELPRDDSIVPFLVARCNRFKPAMEQSISDMREMAFFLTYNLKGDKGIGFVTAAEFKKRHGDDFYRVGHEGEDD